MLLKMSVIKSKLTSQRFIGFARSFRKPAKQLLPKEETTSHSGRGFQKLIKPLGFSAMISSCSFVGCTLWEYESIRNTFRNKGNINTNEFFGKAGNFRRHINHYWSKLNANSQLVFYIITINAAVFCLWRIRPLTATMNKWFLSSPYSGAPCSSMLLSTFSHYSLFHIAANMYVLWSFTPTITGLLGREQFLSLYLSAAVISSFTSYVYKVLCAAKKPSLGASGAVLAVLGAVCNHYPDSRLSFVFVDQMIPHSFSAGSALKCIIAFDIAGCIFGWRYIDHAAHLGGVLFGMWYVSYGHKLLWGKREPIIKKWHAIRGKPE